MTDTMREEIRNHIVHGLNALVSSSSNESLVVENCADEADFASQLTQLGVNVAIHRRRMARMHELETALKRLAETDYGLCEECGETIGVRRLKANPSARLCVTCQSEVEDDLTHCA